MVDVAVGLEAAGLDLAVVEAAAAWAEEDQVRAAEEAALRAVEASEAAVVEEVVMVVVEDTARRTHGNRSSDIGRNGGRCSRGHSVDIGR